MSKSKTKKILIQLTGSIACYKACQLISLLVQSGHEVQCIATASALKFIGEASLEGLTDRKVIVGMFEPRHHKDHINLVKWSDVIVLYPATANTINRLRAGMADDLISALFLANNFKRPYLIAPAMNHNMLEHPATQESMEVLSGWGAFIFETEEGMLACGDVGKGRIISPDVAFKKIVEVLG